MDKPNLFVPGVIVKQMLQFWAGSSFDGAVSVNDLPAASETLLRGADSTGRRTGPLAKTFVPNEVWGKFVQGVKANKRKLVATRLRGLAYLQSVASIREMTPHSSLDTDSKSIFFCKFSRGY